VGRGGLLMGFGSPRSPNPGSAPSPNYAELYVKIRKQQCSRDNEEDLPTSSCIWWLTNFVQQKETEKIPLYLTVKGGLIFLRLLTFV
jgi:hypothetical protein